MALSDLQESGSARKTAAGFIMNDRRLHEVVAAWAANGDWPEGSNPSDPSSILSAVPLVDERQRRG